MKTIMLSSKNQIVVPSAVRKKMSASSADRFIVAKITATEAMLRKEP
ncbi:hypothetical protein JNM87_03380 [Candidatus Saccharibacteria bacterium]|nr:hypothetical protein [Candidatus Saccharibacteria bacterium]